MAKDKLAVTQGVRVLRNAGIDFVERPYKYEDRGGTEVAARQLGVDEHQVIKTLVMEDEGKNVFLVLMHGDREVSTKALARVLGAKTVSPCDGIAAQKHTGYMVGGISPFGTRKPLPVYVEQSILDLPSIFINAGRRGLLAQLSPGDLGKVLKPLIPVKVSRDN
ncbi:MAG: Cys-tRNA(Pro) deacylase [Syntrophobacteraceae bacterium]